MKKFTAIFLLFIMTIVAAHPVVAMHYCGGKFHNIQLYQIENNHSCCHFASEENTLDSGTSCCALTQKLPTQKQTNESYNNICCEFKIAQLSTDEYQNQQQHNLTSSLVPAIAYIFLINFSEVIQFPEIDKINLKKHFPPTGRFLADVDFHSYICIYRI